MRLLVSVRDPAEASAAVRAGADIVDVKEPADGPLAPVSPAVLAAIARAVPAGRPLGVALGEPAGPAALGAAIAARRAALEGREAYVKFVPPAGEEAACVAVVRSALPEAHVVVAGYADDPGTADARARCVRAACAAGADGVLLDTRDKSRGLLRHVPGAELAALAALAGAHGLFLALAGSLAAGDVERVAALGAAVAGVRGAACDGGRAGALSEARVAALVTAARRARRAPAAPA